MSSAEGPAEGAGAAGAAGAGLASPFILASILGASSFSNAAQLPSRAAVSSSAGFSGQSARAQEGACGFAWVSAIPSKKDRQWASTAAGFCRNLA